MLFKTENNAQKFSEQLEKNFGKVQQTTFSPPKMVKITLSKVKKRLNFDAKTKFFVVTYELLELST